MSKTKPFKLKLTAALIPLLFAVSGSLLAADKDAQILELFVDQDTKQIFSEPGPNRVKMGDFKPATKADADDVNVKLGKKGLQFETEDGNFSMKIGGRLHADATYHDSDNNLVNRDGDLVEPVDGTEIRRGRIYLEGTLYEDFEYIIETDFGGDEVSVKDLFLTYNGFDAVAITAGHQKHAISMEVQESSNDIMFTERSLVTALTLPFFDRAIGLNLKSSGKNWSAQGGIYGDSLGDSGDSEIGDEGGGWGSRVTFAPINTDSRVLHFGANLGQRKSNDANTGVNSRDSTALRYKTTNMSDFALANTGSIPGFDDVVLGGLEAAAMYGPFSVQSEYAKAKVDREVGSRLDFDAFYVQMGWTLTGESRTYKGSDGEFKRLKPKNNFSLENGTWGAWELAARYDQVDLVDQDIIGGEQKRATLALNWYLNENVRLMADYSRAFDLEDSPITTLSGDEPDDIDVFALRAQWAF